ncbi:MAG: hypothetical protein ACXVI6_06215, partial [Candidatus Aminicenantales bacterium]
MKKAAVLVMGILFIASGTALPQNAVKPAAKAEAKAEKKSLLTSEALAGLEFRNIGPALMSGRISDIAIHPKNR